MILYVIILIIYSFIKGDYHVVFFTTISISLMQNEAMTVNKRHVGYLSVPFFFPLDMITILQHLAPPKIQAL